MGPLEGVKVIEIAGIGPGPFAAMMLSDMGAEVLRVDRVENARVSSAGRTGFDVLSRGRRSIAADLKSPDGVALVLDLVERADALLEGFRPGVMERLGLGPDECLQRNPGLVYGRMTGWGQEGPLSRAAGHDINYIALAGALGAMGRKGEAPIPPLNLVGDFGGGGMLLAYGVVCALLERARSGQGQVVDAAMVDGTAALMAVFFGAAQSGFWGERGTNLLDTGAHFYDVYETSDGQYVSIGPIEPQFYAELIQRTGLEGEDLPAQMDRAHWPGMKERLVKLFKTKTRDEWCAALEGRDVCFAPVLSLAEAPEHPHAVARGAFVEIGGATQPRPAPRFSRTSPGVPEAAARPGEHTDRALAEWGIPADRIASLRDAGAIA